MQLCIIGFATRLSRWQMSRMHIIRRGYSHKQHLEICSAQKISLRFSQIGTLSQYLCR
uniref:Secreted protein n=1 Tax=Ascaris lumbricoides TaxID=6252 RepID=A0A0M3HJ91_ASCLU